MLSVFWCSNHVDSKWLLIYIYIYCKYKYKYIYIYCKYKYIYIYYIYILYNAKLSTSFHLLLSKTTEQKFTKISLRKKKCFWGPRHRMMRVKSVWLCTRRGAARTMSLCEGTGETSSLDIGSHAAPKELHGGENLEETRDFLHKMDGIRWDFRGDWADFSRFRLTMTWCWNYFYSYRLHPHLWHYQCHVHDQPWMQKIKEMSGQDFFASSPMARKLRTIHLKVVPDCASMLTA